MKKARIANLQFYVGTLEYTVQLLSVEGGHAKVGERVDVGIHEKRPVYVAGKIKGGGGYYTFVTGECEEAIRKNEIARIKKKG